MASFEMTAPDGSKHIVDAPKGATESQALDYFKSTWKPAMPWTEVASSAATNFIPSAGHVVGDTLKAALHPVDTGQGILDLGNAALQKVLPEPINNLMHKLSPETANNPEKLSAVADFYANRYGSMEGFKQALAKDPAGVMADASTLFTGGGAALSKVPQLVRAGEIASKAAKYLDPMTLAGTVANKTAGAVGAVLPSVLGTTTGVGSQAIQEAYNAGKTGGEDLTSLVSSMRGLSEISDPVEKMRNALKNMRKDTSAKYNVGLEEIKSHTAPVDLLPIEEAINKAVGMKKVKSFDLDPKLASTRQDIATALDDFKTAMVENPELNSIYGLDALKQRIGSLADYGDPRSPETMMARNVSGAIKDEIAKQSDEYAKIMKAYGTSTERAGEIEKTLSLGKKAREETAIGKAQGLTRNNVNTSYGHRLKLAQELQNYSDTNFLPEIYGQALSNKAPRGLGGVTAGGIVGAGVMSMNPLAIPAAALTSPRLMGEAAVEAGKIAAALKKGKGAVSEVLGNTNIDPKILANILYQSQQPKEDR